MSDLAKRLENLPADKRALLETRLQAIAAKSVPARAPIPRRDSASPCPLSFSQEQLWLLDQIQPGQATYNVSEILRLEGQLDVAAMEKAINEVVRRHEALRTVFQAADGDAVQVIRSPQWVPLRLTSLESVSASNREMEACQLANEEARRPFDLANGPLLRVRLLRLNERLHLLLLNLHHIISDGWSAGIFIREVVEFYKNFYSGTPASVAELPIQYADFAAWQRASIKEGSFGEELAYWRNQLAGAPALLELPADHRRPAVQSFRGDFRAFNLGPQLSAALTALSKREKITLFVTLLAAFKTLLHRYSRQADILIGSPVANRNREEFENLIGYFVNVVVMRTHFDGDPTFKEVLRRVRETALGAFSHQDLPFETLVKELRPVRDTSFNPLFQVMFALQNTARAEWELPNLTVTSSLGETKTSRFDLTLFLFEAPEGLHGTLEYSADLFEAQTIDRMLSHFRTLLEQIVEDPDQRVSQIPLLSASERSRLLVEWNATAREYPRERCLHELFEAQAARVPDAVAVEFEGARWTYHELNARANQLAHYLQSLGVGPDVLVGLCVERSLNMVAGVLGILKAGGAYVPLDPAYPQERLNFMLADAQALVLLTQKSLVKNFAGPTARVVCLDADWPKIAEESAADLPSGGRPHDLAYVIYTSGSTGQPKGVQIPHTAVVNFLESMRREPGLSEDDTLLAVTTLSFDIAGLDLHLPLTSGAKVVVASRATAADGPALKELLTASGANVMQATPATWWLLIEAGWAGDARLKILCCGEALARSLADELLKRCGQLWNGYGPTETTIYSTLGRVTAGSWPVTIGRPLANTTIYIVDTAEQPASMGLPGELLIGGAGLARGYRNRPELTAEKFVVDPFSAAAGARVYRTGDLARWRTDGTIEFLGRLDSQVKVRGFRIELGEIESVLSRHSAVKQAVVSVREDKQGDKRIVAYLVPSASQIPAISELRSFLSKLIPDYMVPSAFVILGSFPLTPSGKVDRRALPAPEQQAEGHRAPRTPAEEVLCGLFAEMLKLQRVGIEDNFFALGGHSLLATRLVSRVRATLGVEIAIRTLFEAPTVAELANSLHASVAGRPALVRQVRPDRLPLSYAQQRLWFLHRLEGPSPTYNIPIALHLEGELDPIALEAALADVVARHESLRTIFPEVEGVSFQQILPVEQAHLALLTEAVTEAALASRLAEAASTGIELSLEIPLRVWLLQLEPQRHVLLLLLHHIAGDGWSIGLLWRDVAQAYAARRRGETPAFAGLAVQYADYSLWQRETLGEESDSASLLAQQLGFWRTALAGAPEELSLPADHPRPAMISYRGATLPLRLDAGLHRHLRELALANGASLFMVLHAGLAALLSRLGAGEDILIGSPVAGRGEQALENLVGFFVNTLVLRTDVSGDPSFSGLLERVRSFDLEAYEHQDVPFEQVVEALKPARSLARHPLFQVMLVLQNAPEAELALPGLAVRPETVMLNVTKFDLTIELSERLGPGGQPLGIEGGLEYSVDLFERETVEAMAARFVRLLEAAVASPDVTLQRLEILGPGEQQLLLESFNATARPLPEATLPELFEAQVARAPEATAVVFGEESLTYQELNARANRLARHLIGLGVSRGALVGLFLDRSLEMVVSLLGVLKAGAAYVPLDPLYPQERLAFMIRDAGMAVLLTQAALAERLPSNPAVVLLLDQDWEWIEAEESTSSSMERNCPEDLAYVIYTSGSTGKPKGVMIPHRAICNHMHWMQRVCPLTPGDVVLQKTPFSFDASVWEFYAPLLAGGRLIMARPEGHADSAYLVRSVIEHKVSILQLVPSVLRLLLSEPDFEQCRSLKRVFCGGETLTVDLQERFFECLPTASLHNLYGPTEAAIDSTFWTCRRETVARTIPIGSPIDNTQAYILDARLQPVPVGVPGELCIGGEGLARGYLNQPGLTAEKFIANPFAAASGRRLYRTGDRVRYLADGAIEFLGRMDHQVKVRGFRIELGEIESLLLQHAAVRDALAVVREDRPGDQKLVAYVVMRVDQKASNGELRAYLGAQLPDYMVPSVFVFLESLPLLPNGKVDRGALPWPDLLGTETTDASPHTPFEAVLVQIWAEVLGLARVGVHDNFFALGGHSLLATQIISRVRDAFQVELPLRALFQAPTVCELALILVQQMLEAAG